MVALVSDPFNPKRTGQASCSAYDIACIVDGLLARALKRCGYMKFAFSAAATFSSAVVQTLLLIATLPLYLSIIGVERYGVIVVVWLLIDYATTLNLGMDRALVTLLPKLKSGDEERGRLVISAVVLGLVPAVLLSVAMVLGTGQLMATWLSISPDLVAEAATGLLVVAVFIPIYNAGSIITGFLQAEQRFIGLSAVQLISAMAFQLLPIAAALLFGPNLSAVLMGAAAGRLALPILVILMSARSGLVLRELRPRRSSMSTLLGLGSWSMLTNLISPLYSSIDRYLISNRLGPVAVSLYSVPYSLVSKGIILPMSISTVLTPRLSRSDDVGQMQLTKESVLGLAMLFTPVLVLAMFLIEPFLVVWLGELVPEESILVGEILIVGIWFNGLAYVPFSLLNAKGRPDLIAKAHVLELVPFIVLLWLLVPLWGIVGAAVTWALRAAADSALLYSWAGTGRMLWTQLWFPAVVMLVAFGAAWLELPSWVNVLAALCCLAGLAGWIAVAAPASVRGLGRDALAWIGRK